MKNWDKVEADEVRLLNKHFTSGRSGKKIDRIVIHHNAGNLSIAQIYNTWQSRRASAHYQVDKNGRIGQLVWDRDTAWHAANTDANQRSIGIEHANNAFAPNWTVSGKTLEEGAHLVAALCVYYKLGRPSWGKNVFPHSRYTSTACPGALGGSQQSKYMSRAQAWYDSMVGGKAPSKPKPTPKPKPKPSKSVTTLAKEVIAGKHGNGAARKKSLGSKYDDVQKKVNEILSGKKPSKPKVNIDALARAVIRGEYGNGAERKRRLGSNYNAVQKRVNQML